MNEIVEREHRVYMPTFRRQPLVLARGAGCYVWDEDDKRYLDLVAGIAVNVLGHAHPRLVAAVTRQASTLLHVSNLYYTRLQVEFAELVTTMSEMDHVFFTNSGAEANEAAIKLARKYGKVYKDGAYGIVTARQSFHGRTLTTLAATGQEKYQKPFTPLPPGFSHVPFDDIAALKAATDESTVAIMLEPVQGESGIYPSSEHYLEDVRAWCDECGLLLILDEIQCGLGRTGTFLAAHGYGVRADIVTLAKGLCGGLPAGAALASGRASCFEPGDHGSTLGGNPLICAAGLATLTTIVEDRLMENAANVGSFLLGELSTRKQQSDLITEVRGRGLMLAFDVRDEQAQKVVSLARERGLLLNATGPSTVRVVPPLTLTLEQATDALSVLDEVLVLL